ncbi:MAG: hypothetical protein ACREIP_22485, partial [Alphaproteobacteria bacterium]
MSDRDKIGPEWLRKESARTAPDIKKKAEESNRASEAPAAPGLPITMAGAPAAEQASKAPAAAADDRWVQL